MVNERSKPLREVNLEATLANIYAVFESKQERCLAKHAVNLKGLNALTYEAITDPNSYPQGTEQLREQSVELEENISAYVKRQRTLYFQTAEALGIESERAEEILNFVYEIEREQ